MFPLTFPQNMGQLKAKYWLHQQKPILNFEQLRLVQHMNWLWQPVKVLHRSAFPMPRVQQTEPC
jgi:hypothetical protein